MNRPWFRRVAEGLTRTRDQLSGQFNVLLRRGPDLDEEFWSDLEDVLIGADMGVSAVGEMVDELRDQAARHALPDAESVITHLAGEIAGELDVPGQDFLSAGEPVVVLVVGVNGTGKTTTVGKLAHQAAGEGRSVLVGSADTFRAAAIEQLDVWADRAGVPVVRAGRGADPAAVAFDTVSRANAERPDLTLVDTAGRLHTSADLMAELQKVQRVAASRSDLPVRTLLVMDATTGQNGLAQARRFHEALGVDGIALTKLDGTAKGGIAVAIARDLALPILRVGVGEGPDDLRPFSAVEFAAALTAPPA
ncbi:MAG: signal recognition particle-docking protein FtsY [Coriobacteriia bacterium]|nr:signal recognition particle-docking protein FtsY [Coriobacteriia bacterium]